MNLSLGEFRALVAKAFRGAGYPWGLAEDAGYAAKTLAEAGGDAGPAVARLLQAVDGRRLEEFMPDDNWTAPGGQLCPICTGAWLSDLNRPDVPLGEMLEPELLLPEAPAGDRSARVDLDEVTLRVLEGFAHRTYAPDTEESRVAGAGAGLTDND